MKPREGDDAAGSAVIPIVHIVHKEKEKGAKRKRNDYYYVY